MDSTRNSVIMARPNRPRIYLNNSVHLTVFDLGITAPPEYRPGPEPELRRRVAQTRPSFYLGEPPKGLSVLYYSLKL